jgi:hypothetical protein
VQVTHFLTNFVILILMGNVCVVIALVFGMKIVLSSGLKWFIKVVDNARYWWCRRRGMPMVPLWTKEEGINWKKFNIETKYWPLGSNLPENKRWNKKLNHCCPTSAHILFLLNFYPISWINWNIWRSWINTKNRKFVVTCCYSFTFSLSKVFFPRNRNVVSCWWQSG